MIKPIPTKYKEYQFRSRLEARWAVFFDKSGIKWDYEIEGYDINGVWYLPDFYLEEFDCFIETKGQQQEFNPELLLDFRREIGKPLYMIFGQVPSGIAKGQGNGYLESIESLFDINMGNDKQWGYDDMFLKCTRCNKITIANSVYETQKDFCDSCNTSHARMCGLRENMKHARTKRFTY